MIHIDPEALVGLEPEHTFFVACFYGRARVTEFQTIVRGDRATFLLERAASVARVFSDPVGIREVGRTNTFPAWCGDTVTVTLHA